MPPRFSRLEQRLSTSIDRFHAEAMQLEPRAGGEYAGAPDPEREGYTFQAVVDFNPIVASPNIDARGQTDPTGIATDKIHVSINVATLPPDHARWPRQGDFIVLVDRPAEKKLRIGVVEPDGMSRLLCRCMRTK